MIRTFNKVRFTICDHLKKSFSLCHNITVKRSFLSITILMNMHIMAQAATISSTDTGGNWNSAVSWVGGIIPGAADDVVIVSTATITVSADANARTLDVFGTIVTDDNVTLTIQGNVIIESFADLCLSGNTSCGGSITLTDINDQSIGTMELPLAIKYGESSRKDQWLNSF